MYALKDTNNLIIDVSAAQPVATEIGVIFNDCLYNHDFGLTVVQDVPDYVKPQRFTTVDNVTFEPKFDDLSPYEVALTDVAQDQLLIELYS